MKKRKKLTSTQRLRRQLAQKDAIIRKAKLVSLLLASFNLFLVSVLITTFYNLGPIRAQVYTYSQTAQVTPTP